MRIADVYGAVALIQDISWDLVSVVQNNGFDLSKPLDVTKIQKRYRTIRKKLISGSKFCSSFSKQNGFIDECEDTKSFDVMESLVEEILSVLSDEHKSQSDIEKSLIDYEKRLKVVRESLLLFTSSFSEALVNRSHSGKQFVFSKEEIKIKSKPKKKSEVDFSGMDWKDKLSYFKDSLINNQKELKSQNSHEKLKDLQSPLASEKTPKQVYVDSGLELSEEEAEILKERISEFEPAREKALEKRRKFMTRRKSLYGVTKVPIMLKPYTLTKDQSELLERLGYNLITFIEGYTVFDDIKMVWILKKFVKNMKISKEDAISQVLHNRNLKYSSQYGMAGNIYSNNLYFFVPILQKSVLRKHVILKSWSFNLD